MPIEMPKGLPFSVDTFSPTSKKKRHHFLTHAHRDHTLGISSHSHYPIYTTHITKSLLLHQFSQLDESLFVSIEVGQTLVVDDPDGEFTVSAYHANHCPGAVMFLFEGNFGSILHTGDCRLTSECLQSLPEKYIGRKGKKPRCQLDYIFLDCTFGKFSQKLPSKHSSIRQVISCIWTHPSAPVVYLTCDLLGQEEILINVSKTFGSKIFVDRATNPECFQSLMLIAPDILSEDPSTRFHIFNGFPKLYERASAKLAEARANFQPEPLIIRPSAQWYVCEEENLETSCRRKLTFAKALKDQFGVWHVCYSMHSSREELEWALQLLAPKRVVSTTPSCRAMELDYVRKHCFGNPITSNDPLWKLLDISVEASLRLDESIKSADCAPVVEVPSQSSAESELKSVTKSPGRKELLSLSPPGTRPRITLFGRARLGLEDSNVLSHKKKMDSEQDDPLQMIVHKNDQERPFRDVDAELDCQTNFWKKSDVTTGQCEKKLEQEVCNSSFCCVGSTCRENKIESAKDDSPQVVVYKSEQVLLLRDVDVVVNDENKFDKVEIDATGMQCGKLAEKRHYNGSVVSLVGSSSFSESLRKLYRSRNVPVPHPLPSLVELMNANKRARRRFEF